MSYFSDLNLRLHADGIYPDRMCGPACPGCGHPQAIIAYERRRLVFSCRTATCVRTALQSPLVAS